MKEKGHGVKEKERARERERKRERERESHGPLSKDEAGCRGGHQVKECVSVCVCVCVRERESCPSLIIFTFCNYRKFKICAVKSVLTVILT